MDRDPLLIVSPDEGRREKCIKKTRSKRELKKKKTTTNEKRKKYFPSLSLFLLSSLFSLFLYFLSENNVNNDNNLKVTWTLTIINI